MAVKCKAKRPRDGQPCQAYAIHGATVCVAHGGRAPAVKRKAQERLAEAEFVKQQQRRYGGPTRRDVSPSEAVLTELSWSSVHVEWLREKVAAEDGARHVDEYGKERDRLTRIAEVAARMGIEERQVALAEAMGAELLMLRERAVAQLPAAWQSKARRAFQREIEALGSGDAS